MIWESVLEYAFRLTDGKDIISMLLLNICSLVAAKVRFATRKSEKKSSFKDILLDFA